MQWEFSAVCQEIFSLMSFEFWGFLIYKVHTCQFTSGKFLKKEDQ